MALRQGGAVGGASMGVGVQPGTPTGREGGAVGDLVAAGGSDEGAAATVLKPVAAPLAALMTGQEFAKGLQGHDRDEGVEGWGGHKGTQDTRG